MNTKDGRWWVDHLVGGAMFEISRLVQEGKATEAHEVVLRTVNDAIDQTEPYFIGETDLKKEVFAWFDELANTRFSTFDVLFRLGALCEKYARLKKETE